MIKVGAFSKWDADLYLLSLESIFTLRFRSRLDPGISLQNTNKMIPRANAQYAYQYVSTEIRTYVCPSKGQQR